MTAVQGALPLQCKGNINKERDSPFIEIMTD